MKLSDALKPICDLEGYLIDDLMFNFSNQVETIIVSTEYEFNEDNLYNSDTLVIGFDVEIPLDAEVNSKDGVLVFEKFGRRLVVKKTETIKL